MPNAKTPPFEPYPCPPLALPASAGEAAGTADGFSAGTATPGAVVAQAPHITCIARSQKPERLATFLFGGGITECTAAMSSLSVSTGLWRRTSASQKWVLVAQERRRLAGRPAVMRPVSVPCPDPGILYDWIVTSSHFTTPPAGYGYRPSFKISYSKSPMADPFDAGFC